MRSGESGSGRGNAFAISGHGIEKRLIVNSESGLLKDSDLEATDCATHICQTGTLLIKRKDYKVPIGQRITTTRKSTPSH